MHLEFDPYVLVLKGPKVLDPMQKLVALTTVKKVQSFIGEWWDLEESVGEDRSKDEEIIKKISHIIENLSTSPIKHLAKVDRVTDVDFLLDMSPATLINELYEQWPFSPHAIVRDDPDDSSQIILVACTDFRDEDGQGEENFWRAYHRLNAVRHFGIAEILKIR